LCSNDKLCQLPFFCPYSGEAPPPLLFPQWLVRFHLSPLGCPTGKTNSSTPSFPPLLLLVFLFFIPTFSHRAPPGGVELVRGFPPTTFSSRPFPDSLSVFPFGSFAMIGSGDDLSGFPIFSSFFSPFILSSSRREKPPWWPSSHPLFSVRCFPPETPTCLH